jgi:hypothetical protein
MAIRELIALGTTNHDIAASTQFRAGTIVAKSSTTGQISAACRSTTTTGLGGGAPNTALPAGYIGLAADDTAKSGNTMIINDPVGSTFVNTSDNTKLDNYANGFYVAPKRALSFNQAEDLTDVTNFTAGATGFEGPRRGCAVYSFPGAQFVTDMHLDSTGKKYKTVGATGGGVSFLDADASSDTWNITDQLTYGAGANAGLFVKLSSSTDGLAVARIDAIDTSAGLIWITQLV